MPNNPFKPPESPVKKPAPATTGSPWKAVATGLVVDIGGSTLVGIVLSVFYAAQLANSGMSQDQVKEAMTNIPPDSPIAILGTLMGALCSVAGGYVCARIVRKDEWRVGSVMAALSAFLGLAMGSDDTPDDLLVLLTLSTLACVLLGVKYGRERNHRVPPVDPAKPPSPPGP